MNSVEMMGILINGVVALVVAFLGYKQKVREKKDDEYRALREELEKERDKQIKQQNEAREERLNAIEQNLKTLSEDVKELNAAIKNISMNEIVEIKKQLKNLKIMETENFSYIQSLSGVVTFIGESLCESTILDEPTINKLGNSIEEHKKNAMDIHTKLYQLIL